jgi:hypothetical protein
VLKSNLIAAIQFEIRRHDSSTFSENGLVVPGCPACKKRLNTLGQFMDHLADSIPLSHFRRRAAPTFKPV